MQCLHLESIFQIAVRRSKKLLSRHGSGNRILLMITGGFMIWKLNYQTVNQLDLIDFDTCDLLSYYRESHARVQFRGISPMFRNELPRAES